MKDVSVLIYSCDKYADVWGPFFTLFFRYWDCPYQVYVATESEQCLIPEVKTITAGSEGEWTDIIKRAVKEIPTKYVIGMCEDFFFRRPVRQNIIDDCIGYMEQNDDIACFNFEMNYDGLPASEYPNFGRMHDGSSYRQTCQATLWRTEVLYDLLIEGKSPWGWELTLAPDKYNYYVWNGPEDELVFEYGYHNHQWMGLQKGAWVAHDVVPLFEKEGIKVDFSIRGIA